jgi:Domain of unknown function (DUF3850)
MSNSQREHDLKCLPNHFEQSWSGNKPFEIRRNDRDFQVGDLVRLHEWLPDTEHYSGRTLTSKITTLCDYAQSPGMIVMGLSFLPNHSHEQMVATREISRMIRQWQFAPSSLIAQRILTNHSAALLAALSYGFPLTSIETLHQSIKERRRLAASIKNSPDESIELRRASSTILTLTENYEADPFEASRKLEHFCHYVDEFPVPVESTRDSTQSVDLPFCGGFVAPMKQR